MTELLRRQAVERRRHVRDVAEGVFSVSNLEGNGIDFASSLRLGDFLLDREADGDVERVSTTHLGDLAEVREDQLKRFRDAFCGNHAQLSEEVGTPREHLPCGRGEDNAVRRSTGDVGDLFIRERRNEKRRLRMTSVENANGRRFRVGFVHPPEVDVGVVGLVGCG